MAESFNGIIAHLKQKQIVSEKQFAKPSAGDGFPVATEAETRRRKKQDATRKRVALWLGPDDAKALALIQKRGKLPTRIATFRWLIANAKEPTP